MLNDRYSFVFVLLALVLAVFGAYASQRVRPTIDPLSVTVTAMVETAFRIHSHILANHDYPESLAELKHRAGYQNRIVDYWGTELLYSVRDDGEISLISLGSDGAVGGDGSKQDITLRYATRSANGELEIARELGLADLSVSGQGIEWQNLPDRRQPRESNQVRKKNRPLSGALLASGVTVVGRLSACARGHSPIGLESN